MPFYLYGIEKAKEGLIYKMTREVTPVAGKRGPLYSFVSRTFKKAKDGHLTWEMSEDQILLEIGVRDLENSSLLVDLKPTVKNNVSLYRLKKIWGYSTPTWTPLAVQLESIFVDKEVRNPKSYKKHFSDPGEEGDLIHEFLYLQGGTREGNWLWGRVGSVNGTLLWEDAFNHFARCIAPYTGLTKL